MKSVRQEAARWFLRWRQGDLDDSERQRFEEWRAQSPVHADEYSAIEAVWEDFDSCDRLEDLASAVEQREVRRQHRRRLIKQGTLGLFLLAGTLISLWQSWALFNRIPNAELSLASTTGHVREEALPDNSRVTLNAETLLKVSYYNDRREVLLKRGEAIFNVKRDPQRPFMVHSHNAEVRVLGTRFMVTQLRDRSRISVEAGRVSIAGTDEQELILQAGEMADVTVNDEIQRISGSVEDAFAWRRGVLVFSDTPLDEIAQSLSRYRHQPVIAENNNGSQLRITAVVQVDDIEEFIEALPNIASVRVDTTDDATRIVPVSD